MTTLAPTWEQLALLLSVATPALLFLVGKILDRRISAKSIKSIEAGTDQTNAAVRKIESEVALSYITGSKELVEGYKEMLKDLTTKYEDLEKRLVITESRLENEIIGRKELINTFYELFSGGHILVEQLREEKLEPKWTPSEKLMTLLKKMREDFA